MKMTSRERVLSILNGRPADRPSVKLWGLSPGQHLLHADFQPVYDLAVQTTDLFCGASSAFDFVVGALPELYETIRTPRSAEWTDVETILHTPMGSLSSIAQENNFGKPGYVRTHLIKEPEDIKKILSIPYRECPVNLESYFQTEQQIADRGITMYYLDHPGYAMQRLMGSELLALFSKDEREWLIELSKVFAARLKRHVEAALAAGLHDAGKNGSLVFGWVGPELLIPPLLSFNDFEEFCFDIDKPLIDIIHTAGGKVWVHCHGKVGQLIERFAAMGCDMLNPIEPPPMGDIELETAFRIADKRMALEGNIEIHEIMEAPEERLRELIETALNTGSQHGRFVLCPSAGYMEDPAPSATLIQNLMTYVQFGLECAERYHY